MSLAGGGDSAGASGSGGSPSAAMAADPWVEWRPMGFGRRAALAQLAGQAGEADR